MGANLLVLGSSVLLPPLPPNTDFTEQQPSPGIARVMSAGLMLLIFLLGGCRMTLHRPAETGHLEAEWSGSDRGKISAPASAEWCGARRLLEIRAVQGDTGIALALYVKDTLTAGRYLVVDPLKAESLPPAAGVALRWFTQSAVKGFQGATGTVFLELPQSGELAGNVTARARSVIDTQWVAVKGTFEALTVRPSPGCFPPGKTPNGDAQPDDTVVH